MQTKEIQQNEWPTFFDSFSRQHEGWLVDLEIFGPEIGDQVEQRGLPLEGISAEWNEGEGYLLAIMMGSKPDDHITHSIARAIQVNLEQTDEGADTALAIKAADGTTTLLRAAILPEIVHAIAT